MLVDRDKLAEALIGAETDFSSGGQPPLSELGGALHLKGALSA